MEIEDYDKIIESLKSIYDNPQFFFFDEVQNLPKWELFVNRLQRQGYNLIITGSNSKLLSRELSTHLTGRHAKTIVFPFSFKEYLRYFDNELTETEIKSKLIDYLKKGGFPEPLVKNLDYKSYLQTMYDSIIFKDIVKRYNIRHAKQLEELSNFLISNAANLISYKGVTASVNIKSVHTVEKYMNYLEDSFLFFKLNAFSFKVKEQIKSNKKVYVVDNGLINAKSFGSSENTGKLYENLVAVQLRRKEADIYYYKNPQGYEVDFVVKEGLKVKHLIQVCYDIEDINTKKRETRALLHASRNLKCKNLLVITEDYENEEMVEWFGMKGKIKFIPLWRFLLDPKQQNI